MSKKWRLIISEPADAAENMALDEAIFNEQIVNSTAQSVVRIYSWSMPCCTIGYFQKHPANTASCQVVRRLTGGLTVEHGKDLSYALITNKNDWKYIYDQNQSYRMFHEAIREVLNNCGIRAEFCLKVDSGNKLVCKESLLENDLCVGDKKILGSCQRRRGSTLLQQGSMHMDLDKMKFINLFTTVFEKYFAVNLFLSSSSEQELLSKEILKNKKYTTDKWNRKYL